MATEDLIEAGIFATESQIVEAASPPSIKLLETELEDIIFRLRAYTDNGDGDLAIGIEMGMQRAADMIEHLLNRHRETNIG